MQHTLTSLVKEANGVSSSFGYIPTLTRDPHDMTNSVRAETPYFHNRTPMSELQSLGQLSDANYSSDISGNIDAANSLYPDESLLFLDPTSGRRSNVNIRPASARGRAIAEAQLNAAEGRDLTNSRPNFGAQYNTDTTGSGSKVAPNSPGFDWSRLLGPGVGALGGLAAGRLASGFMDDEDVEDPRERARIRAANQRRKLMLGLLGAGVGGIGGHYLQNS